MKLEVEIVNIPYLVLGVPLVIASASFGFDAFNGGLDYESLFKCIAGLIFSRFLISQGIKITIKK